MMEKNRAFTLIEMLVSAAIFVSLIGVVSAIFVWTIRLQRQSLAYQELLDQTSYVMEYMSRAIRMAIKDDIKTESFEEKNCLSGYKVNFATSTNQGNMCLKFRNYENKCQEFCRENSNGKKKLVEKIEGTKRDLTSPSLDVTDFTVKVTGAAQGDQLQPLVSISLEIKGKENSKIKIRTKVSQRNLDVSK